ncbi:MAG TPA: Maf-like protein [Bacteroidales bacterium]|nr:Maf-like protein [Bacteroidales bacterium]HPS17858.1 Maf-like protein [Bacteroidales bacterium]
MLSEKLKKYNIILASQSPRRQMLLKGLDINYTLKLKDVNEDFPRHLKREEIALYLAEKKANAFNNDLLDDTLIITADTIVWINNQVLGKPKDFNDAVRILKILSGHEHEVITAICLKTKLKTTSFFSLTKVAFKELSEEEIHYYINNYKPYDKAGAYGAQEWIGYVAIKHIEGSYFNVMGLPTRLLYDELLKF